MSDQLTANFNQKGFTKNFLELMKLREQFKLCCESWLTQIATENSSSISFLGNGTATDPISAVINISTASGNTVVIKSDGIYVPAPIPSITQANDGLSVLAGIVKFGQAAGDSTNPAIITEDRQIPMNGHVIIFTDTIGTSFVRMPAINLTQWVSAPDFSTAIISDWGASNIVEAGNYGEGYQEYSFVNAASGFFGYLGVQSAAYVTGGAGATHNKFTNGYIQGFSTAQVWDGSLGGGSHLIGNIIGLFVALNSQNGTATNAYDIYASELNSVGSTTNPPSVTNHYALFAEAFTKATNNFGVYINGTQKSYFGGNVSIGNTVFAASAVLGLTSTTQGFLPPVMTTTQKNAIATPATGLVVFDSTLGKLCVFSTTWQTITSA